MKRIAASALWLTYYVFVNPAMWIGYWLIELADWIAFRVDDTNDEAAFEKPIDRFLFRLWRVGAMLECDLHDWWFKKLVRTGYGASLVVSYLDEDGFSLPVHNYMTRFPWRKPFSQTRYAITYPELIEEPYANSTWRRVAKQFEHQLV